MFKKFALATAILLLLTPLVLAEYPSGVAIIDRDAISKLSDEQLADTYEQTLVAVEINASYHATSGYSPKEWKDSFDLRLFRHRLRDEIVKRNLTIPE